MNKDNSLTAKARYGVVIATFIAAAFLIVLGTLSYINGRDQQKATENQTQKVETLVQEVKRLSEENKSLNQTSNNYAYCNAVLLSQYTQTQAAITIEDLNKCVLSSFPNGVNAPTASGTGSQSNARVNTSSPTTNRSSNTTNSTTNNNGGTSTNPTPVQPAQPAQPLQPAPSNSSPVLTVPNLLDVNLPCLNVLGAVKTCR